MLERIATLAPASVLYVIAGMAGLLGFVLLWLPFLGLPLLALAFVCYLAAGVARRKARELAVRRQQGG